MPTFAPPSRRGLAATFQRACLPPLRRTLASVRGEWAAFRNRHHLIAPEGRDSFEWVAPKLLRRLYWDHALRTRLPIAIEFEMNSQCNRRCGYCPVSIAPRPKGFLDETAYQRLIDDLAHLGFAGQLVPSFYGEPLLDRRIARFIRYARMRLPNTYLVVYTNADHLDPETFATLIREGVSVFRVSQHDPAPSVAIRRLLAFVEEHPEYRPHVQVRVFADSPERALTSRGGLIQDHRVRPTPRTGCYRSRRCTITFDGSMIICCEDYTASYVYGNVLTEGFLMVWRRSLAQRRAIFLGEYTTPICRVCVGLEPPPPSQEALRASSTGKDPRMSEAH